MEIGSVSSSMQPHVSATPQVARPSSSDVTTTNQSHYDNVPVKVQAVDKVDIASIDHKRGEALQQAVRQAFADVYAVSDTSFTIYKDSKGEYVTRVRSLRDGSVSYYPEPAMLNKLHSVGIDIHGLVKMNA